MVMRIKQTRDGNRDAQDVKKRAFRCRRPKFRLEEILALEHEKDEQHKWEEARIL